MKYMKKMGGLALVFCFLILPIITASTIVEVPRDEAVEKTNIFTSPFSIFKSQVFWGGVVLFFVILLVLLGIFFLVKWIVSLIKSRTDAFYKLKTERIKLAKIQRRYTASSWLKVHKNPPIRLVKKEDGKLVVSRPIAHYRGDYVTHEGNVVISLNLENNKKWFIMPITDLLIIPKKELVDLAVKNSKGDRSVIKIDKLPDPSKIIKFNENEILIFAEGLSNIGMFLIPVLKDKDGEILDLSMPVFDSLKKIVLGEYLYEQTDEFTKLAKKSMDINPNVRAIMKTQDNSQSVEVPSSSIK
jgi:hypothetical protein